MAPMMSWQEVLSESRSGPNNRKKTPHKAHSISLHTKTVNFRGRGTLEGSSYTDQENTNAKISALKLAQKRLARRSKALAAAYVALINRYLTLPREIFACLSSLVPRVHQDTSDPMPLRVGVLFLHDCLQPKQAEYKSNSQYFRPCLRHQLGNAIKLHFHAREFVCRDFCLVATGHSWSWAEKMSLRVVCEAPGT